jgi:hypothetical protein
MDIPEGARAPQDHRSPAEEPEVEDDALLADMPELIPPTKLRPRKRNGIFKLALKLRDQIGDATDLDFNSLDGATLGAVLDVFAEVDEFAETIAVDPAAYVEWAGSASYDQFAAILGRYASAVGESGGSSS